MSYLRLLQNKIQELSETVSSTLNVDVTVTDENLVRIAGTGNFYNKIDKNSPQNCIFEEVIRTGLPKLNVVKENNETCKSCRNYHKCNEKKSMTYPINFEGKCIGVVSFACFNSEQEKAMNEKNEQYHMMLKQISNMIANDIIIINNKNRLIKGNAEINEIINCINKGILIISYNNRILHINGKALSILNLNFTYQKIINKDINYIIKNLKINNSNNKETVGYWKLKNKDIRVVYEVNEIVLEEQGLAYLISFDALSDITKIAMTYENKEKITFSNIIGKSKTILNAIDMARIAAHCDSTVLLEGESGTGKEIFANSIHNESNRKNNKFVAINCASIPENLLEAELFGYEKGAFTGANPKGKIGKFELANNGTLFLDEIGDLPLKLQSKLLRAIQERTIERVGGNTPILVNVRIIAATHKNLIQLVKEKNFRLDLYYRLNVIPIYLPSLRERESDVLLCSEFILKKLCKKMNKDIKFLSNEVKEKLLLYDWPGNIRELENVLEYAVSFSSSREITTHDLPNYFWSHDSTENVDMEYIKNKGLEELTKDFEKKIFKKYIDELGDSTQAKKVIAKKLDISLTTLYRKLNDYQCDSKRGKNFSY